MCMKVFLLTPLAALLASAPSHADDLRRHVLQVSAAAPDVAVSPRAPERNSLPLPTLEYVFALNATCAEPFGPSSISLAVADTRRSLSGDELDGNASAEITLIVPADQLAPVPVAEFCVEVPAEDSSAPAEGERLTLPATLSAHASLLCVSGSEQEIIYTSAPLDVTLICNRGNSD